MMYVRGNIEMNDGRAANNAQQCFDTNFLFGGGCGPLNAFAFPTNPYTSGLNENIAMKFSFQSDNVFWK